MSTPLLNDFKPTFRKCIREGCDRPAPRQRGLMAGFIGRVPRYFCSVLCRDWAAQYNRARMMPVGSCIVCGKLRRMGSDNYKPYCSDGCRKHRIGELRTASMQALAGYQGKTLPEAREALRLATLYAEHLRGSDSAGQAIPKPPVALRVVTYATMRGRINGATGSLVEWVNSLERDERIARELSQAQAFDAHRAAHAARIEERRQQLMEQAKVYIPV